MRRRRLNVAIRFDVVAADEPLTVQFEPAANEIVISAGDRITVEWPTWDYRAPAEFVVQNGRLTIGEPSSRRGTWPRVWNSAGDEITY